MKLENFVGQPLFVYIVFLINIRILFHFSIVLHLIRMV